MSDQVAQTVTQPSIEDRLSAVLNQAEAPRGDDGKFVAKQQSPQQQEQKPVVEAEAPDDQASEPIEASSDEVTTDDLPDEPQSTSDEFEIEWQGQRKVVGREQIRELAQKGYDYTQKTQQLAEERTRLQVQAQALQQTAALQQAVVDDLAEAKAIQRQLAAFPQTPEAWMAASQNDPLGAFQQRTQYDALIQQFNAKAAQIQQKSQHLQQAQGAITAEQLKAEFARAQEKVPAWKNQEQFKKDAASIREFLLAEGYGDREVDSLTDGRALAIAYKAYRYDQLVRAKADKLKQVRTAPPVVKPGAAATEGNVQRSKLQDARQRLKKSGDVNDAAALILRMTK